MEQARERAAPIDAVSMLDMDKYLDENYPRDKYVRILPAVNVIGQLPEYFKFTVSVEKFSHDEKDKEVYSVQGGGLALAKPALMTIASDAGVKIVQSHRLDNGYDPDVVEWRVFGILSGLGGMVPMPATKRIDLALEREKDEWKLRKRPPKSISLPGAKWDNQKKCYEKTPWNQLTTDQQENYIRERVTENDFQRKTYKFENGESKAILRLVRGILGIPGSYPLETIRDKKFAIVQIIFAPEAKTKEERMMITEKLVNVYFPAYYGQGNAGMLGEGPPAPVAIQPHEVRGSLPEGEPIDAPPSPVTPREIETAEVVGNGDNNENEEKKSTTENFEYLQAMTKLKRRFTEALGEDGEAEYYKVLDGFGAKHANEILDRKMQGEVYRALVSKVELVEKNISKGESGEGAESDGEEPEDEWIYKPIRSALSKETKAVLAEKVAKAQLDYDYPIDDDPSGIKELLNESDTKDNLIEAVVRIMRYKIKGPKGGVSQ